MLMSFSKKSQLWLTSRVTTISKIFLTIDIYKLVNISFYNEYMDYCPILLEVGPSQIVEAYNGCKYLLQVYDKEYKKCYEKPLQSNKYLSYNSLLIAPIKVWANCFKYLAYMVEQGSDDSEYIHIVELSTQKTVKVQNFG